MTRHLQHRSQEGTQQQPEFWGGRSIFLLLQFSCSALEPLHHKSQSNIFQLDSFKNCAHVRIVFWSSWQQQGLWTHLPTSGPEPLILVSNHCSAQRRSVSCWFWLISLSFVCILPFSLSNTSSWRPASGTSAAEEEMWWLRSSSVTLTVTQRTINNQ